MRPRRKSPDRRLSSPFDRRKSGCKSRANRSGWKRCSIGGSIRDVVYLGAHTRYLIDLEGGGELVVVQQNLHTTSMDVLAARGRAGAAGVGTRAQPPGAERLIMAATTAHVPAPAPSFWRRASTYFYRRPRLSLFVTLALPLFWLVDRLSRLIAGVGGAKLLWRRQFHRPGDEPV